MSAQPPRSHREPQGPLAGQTNPPVGGLDHDQLGHTVQLSAVAKGLSPYPSVLLVGREAEVNVHGWLEALPKQLERRQDDAGHPALHIRRSATIEPFAVAEGGEGRVRPSLLGIHVHRIQVTGHDNGPPTIPSGHGQNHRCPVGPMIEHHDLPRKGVEDLPQEDDGVLLVAGGLSRTDSHQLPQNLPGTLLGLEQSRLLP